MSETNERPLSTADLVGTERTEFFTENGAERQTGQLDSQQTTPLFADSDTRNYQERWHDVQARFVDEPQAAVQEADSLVAEVMKQLAERFADQRQELEKRWSSGSEVSTEDLRQALQQYRSFFRRLLTA